MDWTEVQVTVAEELEEAVANFFHEGGGGGVVLDRGPAGSVLTAYFPPKEAPLILARLEDYWRELAGLGYPARGQVATRQVAQEDWAEEWKKYYRPFSVGSTYICPSWLEPAPAPGQTLVRLDPGLAFGTGTHPTTQLCLRELAERCRDKTVLDLGSGSGILSIVAIKSGARQVTAVDNDELAVRVAAENARVNGCSFRQVQGDAFALYAQGDYDLAVANISYQAGVRLGEIQRQKKTTLIVSGFPLERLEEYTRQFGDRVVKTACQEGWVCLVLEAG
jgi:ribosomal protein L11 methyltransferase